MPIDSESVFVITGAASGIGRALAVRVAREGIAGLALSDIDAEGLDGTAKLLQETGVSVSTHVMDVSDPDAVEAFAAAVVEKHGRATHLINNAGVGLIGTFDQISIDDFQWLMGINFWGVIYGCKSFMPILKRQPSAHIVNISSVFGLIAPAEQSAYTSAKFAVRGFTESLRHELADTNITVSCVHPGGIKTNIVRNAKLGIDAPEEWKSQGEKFFDKVARTTPETAADVIVSGIKRGKQRILIGSDAAAINVISRLFPVRYLGILERLNGHKLSLRKK